MISVHTLHDRIPLHWLGILVVSGCHDILVKVSNLYSYCEHMNYNLDHSEVVSIQGFSFPADWFPACGWGQAGSDTLHVILVAVLGYTWRGTAATFQSFGADFG